MFVCSIHTDSTVLSVLVLFFFDGGSEDAPLSDAAAEGVDLSAGVPVIELIHCNIAALHRSVVY